MSSGCQLAVERLTGLSTGQLRELESFGREALGESALDEWLLPVIADHGWLYVGRLEGNIMGAAEVIRSREDDALYLEGFYIRPEYQGRGLGSDLLRQIMQKLSRLGFRRLHATLDPGNVVAASLYQAAGFSGGELRQDYYGTGRDRVLLTADIKTEDD